MKQRIKTFIRNNEDVIVKGTLFTAAVVATGFAVKYKSDAKRDFELADMMLQALDQNEILSFSFDDNILEFKKKKAKAPASKASQE